MVKRCRKGGCAEPKRSLRFDVLVAEVDPIFARLIVSIACRENLCVRTKTDLWCDDADAATAAGTDRAVDINRPAGILQVQGDQGCILPRGVVNTLQKLLICVWPKAGRA